MIYQKGPKGQIDQGDILYPVKIKEWIPWWIDNDGHPIVILTPTCDIAHDKVDFHRFTVLQPFPFIFLRTCQEVLGNDEAALSNLSNLSKNKKNKTSDKLGRATRNALPRYPILPKEEPLAVDRFVDFEVVVSVPVDTFALNLRVTRLESPYKEELIHRYSHHTVRLGTEDMRRRQVEQVIDECFNTQTGGVDMGGD